MNRAILAYSYLPRQLPATQRAALRARLPYARAARLRGSALAQSQTLLGVALACALLTRSSGRAVGPEHLRFSPHGKPVAPGLADFSIAHAGAWVVCALTSAGTIGVDIEPVVARRRLPDFSHAFDATERAAARSARAALAIWTAKEATLKAAGATLAELPLVRVRGNQVRFRGARWYCRTPRIAVPAMLRAVTSQPIARLELGRLDPREACALLAIAA